MFSTLGAVPKKEGFLGLYKGNGAMMVRIFPYGAIQFMAFDGYKKVQYVFYSGRKLTKHRLLPKQTMEIVEIFHVAPVSF